MLTAEEDMEISSLWKRGWSIAAIARHTGRDRKTVRAYLAGDREPGVREHNEPDVFDRFEPYVRQRLRDDPHVRATVLFAEAVDLGYDRAYPTFTRSYATAICGRTANRAHRATDEPMWTSSTRPARRSSGTGWSWWRHRGAIRRMCWSALCRTRASSGCGLRRR
jgi:transposase